MTGRVTTGAVSTVRWLSAPRRNSANWPSCRDALSARPWPMPGAARLLPRSWMPRSRGSFGWPRTTTRLTCSTIRAGIATTASKDSSARRRCGCSRWVFSIDCVSKLYGAKFFPVSPISGMMSPVESPFYALMLFSRGISSKTVA